MKINSLKQRHKHVLKLISENRFRLFCAMGFSLLIAATTSAIPFLLKPVLDDIFINKDAAMLKLLPVAVVILYFLRGLGLYGQEYMMNYVGGHIIRSLRDSLYGHIQDLPLSFFHREKTGALMSRITNDVNVIKAMVSNVVTASLRDAFTIVGLVCIILYRDWKMAIFALLILPAASYPIIQFGRRVRKVSTKYQENMAELNSFLHETIAGNKIVKAFGREEYEKKRFFAKNRKLFKVEMRAVVARSLSSPVMEILAGIGIAFILWYGGSRVIAGEQTTGSFISFLAAVILLYDPIRKISALNNAIQQGLAAVDRIFDIIESESDIKEDENPRILEPCNHEVDFKNVFFKYDETMVLKDINLRVKPGEILAIVGMSGGGKTSLVNLVPRFYDVTKGAILIDGIDIKRLSIDSVRRQISIVTQEPILFNDTIGNNIAYGNREASDKDIEQAAKAAFAYNFIKDFPDGFNTNIGELGSRLSGGEKQRICIARALLKNAPVLILDEATSSLDTQAEALVQKALENLMKGRTTFVIAHRLSTVEYAHRIVVLVDGRIVEQGTHESLIEHKGEYFKLCQMQLADSG
jgi:subfamily B ATP-binding cassette protein MsbA